MNREEAQMVAFQLIVMQEMHFHHSLKQLKKPEMVSLMRLMS